jgi:hypothetical protein
MLSGFQKTATLSTSLRLSGELKSDRDGTNTQRPFDASLIAARPQKSGTDINPVRGFIFSSFQRPIGDKEAKQQVPSVVQISELPG